MNRLEILQLSQGDAYKQKIGFGFIYSQTNSQKKRSPKNVFEESREFAFAKRLSADFLLRLRNLKNIREALDEKIFSVVKVQNGEIWVT